MIVSTCDDIKNLEQVLINRCISTNKMVMHAMYQCDQCVKCKKDIKRVETILYSNTNILAYGKNNIIITL